MTTAPRPMTAADIHARFVKVSEEAVALARKPPTPANRARLAQIEREKNRLGKLYRERTATP